MIKFLLCLFLSIGTASSVCPNKGPNLILLTFDGVRHHEFFKGTDINHFFKLNKKERGKIFKTFWRNHAENGLVLGEDKNFKLISEVAISLPSYQSLFLGARANCRNNSCPAVTSETVFDKIQKVLNLNPEEVALFASWEGLQNAVSSNMPSLFNAIHPTVRNDLFLDPQIAQILQKSLLDLPAWKGSRKDEYTFEAAIKYLKAHCPRVLYISLVDSDEYGHEGDYSNYVRSLRTYDSYLDQIINTLKSLGPYGQNTNLIVTTDHSRGKGVHWTHHGKTDDSDKEIFVYMYGSRVEPSGLKNLNKDQSLIRASMEFMMDVNPVNPMPHYLK